MPTLLDLLIDKNKTNEKINVIKLYAKYLV
jgi:hypothetical protein